MDNIIICNSYRMGDRVQYEIYSFSEFWYFWFIIIIFRAFRRGK